MRPTLTCGLGNADDECSYCFDWHASPTVVCLLPAAYWARSTVNSATFPVCADHAVEVRVMPWLLSISNRPPDCA